MKRTDDERRGTRDEGRKDRFVYRLSSIVLVMVAAAFISCAGSPSDDGENYGNLLDSPSGLILVEEEHPDGWRRSDCSMCHNFDNIHLVNRTGLDIDIAAIRQQAITNGDAGCPDCHGANGVE